MRYGFHEPAKRASWRPAARFASAMATAMLAAGCATQPVLGPGTPPIIIGLEASSRPEPLVPRLPICTRLSGIDELAQARMQLGAPSTGRVDYRLGLALATSVGLALEALFPAREGCAIDLEIRARFWHGETTFILGVDLATTQGDAIASFDSLPVYPAWPGTPNYRDARSAAQSVSDQIDRVLAKLLWEVWKSEALRHHAARSGAAWIWPVATSAPTSPPSGVAVVHCDAAQQCFASSAAEAVGAVLAARGFTMIAADALLRAAWPWLSGAGDAEELKDAIAAPWFASRAAEAGVAALVAIAGWSTADDPRGGILCAGGYGAGGCFGLRWTESSDEARVTVVRLATASGSIEVNVARSATTFVMPAFVVPVPIPLPQKTTLSEELAERLVPLLGPPAAPATK